jgi:hypothetical protein
MIMHGSTSLDQHSAYACKPNNDVDPGNDKCWLNSKIGQASFFSRKRKDGRQPPLEHSLWIQMSGNGNIQFMKLEWHAS